jgi:hypothetical protein
VVLSDKTFKGDDVGKRLELFLVLILHIQENSINKLLLLSTNRAKENMCYDVKGKIFEILRSSLQESLVLAPIITLIILFF